MQSLSLPHQPRLDHLRFFAAFLVFMFHMLQFGFLGWKPLPSQAWAGLWIEGHTGIGLFFTLSGFLFMLIALNSQGIQYGRFIRNRFLRIFPLYVFMFFVAISIGRSEFKAEDVLYLFFSNVGNSPINSTFLTILSWSISIEFTFYLVFPFLALFAMQKGPRYLLGLVLFVFVVKGIVYLTVVHSTKIMYTTLIGRFDQFLLGMLAAMWYRSHQAWLERYARFFLLPLVLAMVGATAFLAKFGSYLAVEPKNIIWLFWPTLEAGLWAALIVAYQSTALAWPQWLERCLQRGAQISFSIYLLHPVVIVFAKFGIGFWQPTGLPLYDCGLNALWVFPLVWWLAVLSYESIERPFLELRKNYVTPRLAATPLN